MLVIREVGKHPSPSVQTLSELSYLSSGDLYSNEAKAPLIR